MLINPVYTVLHVDDNSGLCDLTQTILEDEYDSFRVLTTTDPADVLSLLDETTVDCLVSDYDMPGMDGIELLNQVRAEHPSLPVILFTGKGTEEVASNAISAGVTDYLQKGGGTDQYTVLANRIRNAVDSRKNERRRDQYEAIVETAGDAMYVLDEDSRIELVNPAFERMFGYDKEQLVGEHISEFLPSEHVEKGADALERLLCQDGSDAETFSFRAERPDGGTQRYEVTLSLVDHATFDGSVGIIRDSTDERRDEKLLLGLFEESLHGIGVKEIVTNEDGEPIDYIYKQVNDRFEELTGLDADEVVGNRATEVVDGIEETPFIEIFGEVALEGTTAQFEQYSEPLDRYYEVSAFSSRHGECISIFSDVTERKKREQELERYERLIEYSPDLLVLLDEKMTIQYQSPPSPLFEWEPRDVGGENPLEYIHPDDHGVVFEHFSQLVQEKDQIVTTEFRAEDAAGNWQWIESRGQNFTDDETIGGIFAVMREITERKQQEQQLAQYSNILKQLQETTSTLLETTDPEVTAKRVIDTFEAIFEYDIVGIWLSTENRERLEPMAHSERGRELFPNPPTYTADTQSLSWEAYQQQELRYIDDISRYEQRVNSETPIQSEVIAPLGEYGVLNIGSTELDAFTEQEKSLIELWAETLMVLLARISHLELLQEREAELTRERDRLDEFASVVSHDLRNPLNVAVTRTELAAGECESEHFGYVNKALARMDDLLDDVLLLARQGDVVGETTAVDLREVTTRCWQNVATIDATLTIEGTATIEADQSRLAQALENLFRNAVEHSGESVTITVGRTEGGFYVADDGAGIPPDKRSQVFDSGFTTSENGTGFGLAITKRICEAHGWEITATESGTGGARFDITGLEFSE